MSPTSEESSEEQNHTHILSASEDLFYTSRDLYPSSILAGPTSLSYRLYCNGMMPKIELLLASELGGIFLMR